MSRGLAGEAGTPAGGTAPRGARTPGDAGTRLEAGGPGGRVEGGDGPDRDGDAPVCGGAMVFGGAGACGNAAAGGSAGEDGEDGNGGC